MTIKIKIYLGICLFVIIVLGSSIVSILSINKLDTEIKYITGNAWDAADGAMEGTIGIQSQIIALDAFIANEISLEEAKKKVTETNSFTLEALNRMKASGLMDPKALTTLDSYLATLEALKSQILSGDKDVLLNTVASFDKHVTQGESVNIF